MLEQKLVLVTKRDQFTLYRYEPTLFHLLLTDMEYISLKKRLRYLRNYLRPNKYVIYYLAVDDELVGMCAVTPGGAGLKLKCAAQQDIILGPYYILKNHRGNGYSKVLIELVLVNHPDYRYAFDLIANNNEASKRATLASGFQAYQSLRIYGPLRRHLVCSEDKATHTIYRYER